MTWGIGQQALGVGLSVLLLSGMPGSAQGPAQPVRYCAADRAIFPEAGVSIRVEIADDPAERELGLMNRKALDPLSGMLFIYETPRPSSFWMKNTLIPLDMIFMDATGKIRHIHPSAVPLDLTPIPGHAPGDPDPDRLMILEIAGGEAERLGLRNGMSMAYPTLDVSVAGAPCQLGFPPA